MASSKILTDTACMEVSDSTDQLDQAKFPDERSKFMKFKSRRTESHSVKPIDRTTIHRICSGQVVLSLSTAVKELVENSLDAGSTSIEIRLKNHGSECVEIVDNGSGVAEENFAGLTLKHHTSKLQEFNDLITVDTFGFRGEALSSLCALSDVSIHTRHVSAAVGTKLTYDHNGTIVKRMQCAREPGTTVSVSNLFLTLPVRHKEFLKNVKKEFAKMTQVLYAYCLISSGVRISCMNSNSQGRKVPVVTTQVNNRLRENIISVFSAKQVKTLIDFTQTEDVSEELCDEFSLKKDVLSNVGKMFKIEGYISTCSHGSGRSSTDRQFYFINKRPCDPIKISRLINDMYHSFNRHQYPFVCLNISVASRESVDVNVTPDKRQIFLENEKFLLAIIKASLLAMYKSDCAATITMERTHIDRKMKKEFCLSQGGSFSSGGSSTNDSQMSPNLNISLERFKRSNSADSETKSSKKQRKLNTFWERNCSQSSDDCVFIETNCQRNSSPATDSELFITPKVNRQSIVSDTNPCSHLKFKISENDSLHEDGDINQDVKQDVSKLQTNDLGLLDASTEQETTHSKAGQSRTDDSNGSSQDSQDTSADRCEDVASSGTFTENQEDITTLNRRSFVVNFSMEELCNQLDRGSKIHGDKSNGGFYARITPNDNKAAEAELSKRLSKEAFNEMEIIGQFNLGFIITKLKQDIFIIDQHASDEKYNFETLQQSTVLHGQSLIQPVPLNLTAVNESILIDNIKIFHQNGFDFQIDDAAPSTEKVKLKSVPVSNNWTFGKDDIEEMIFMLSDSPGIICRPSRIRQMFASRACRKSVMIGTALRKEEMRKLVTHMAGLEQPWNCPHGRPTMRHLLNFCALLRPDE